MTNWKGWGGSRRPRGHGGAELDLYSSSSVPLHPKKRMIVPTSLPRSNCFTRFCTSPLNGAIPDPVATMIIGCVGCAGGSELGASDVAANELFRRSVQLVRQVVQGESLRDGFISTKIDRVLADRDGDLTRMYGRRRCNGIIARLRCGCSLHDKGQRHRSRCWRSCGSRQRRA